MKKPTQENESIELNELKKRRKQLNFTVESVADNIKVRKDFINYIESGEFDKLGAPTFVRGHVTNYCKVVGIEPALILAQIPEQYLIHQQLKTSDAMGSSPLSHVRRQSNNVGRYAVGTALLGMLSMSFYFIWDKWSLPTDNETEIRLVSNQLSADDNSSNKNVTYSSLIPQVSNSNNKSQLDQGSDSNENLNDANDSGEAPSEEDELTSEANQNINDENSGIGINETTEEPDVLMANDVSTTNLNGSGSGYSIVMKFEEQAWVSIKTLGGESVIQDLLGPGLQEIHDTEPVHFRIGNATKTALSINDSSVELKPFTNKDVADFNWPLEPSS